MFRLTLIAAIALVSTGASADCLPIDQFAKLLYEKYKERPVVRAVDGADHPLVFFANLETGSFTVLMILKSPMACTFSAGTSWLAAAAPPPGKPL